MLDPNLTFIDSASVRALPSSTQRSLRYICTFIHNDLVFYMFRNTTYFHAVGSLSDIRAISFDTDYCLSSSIISDDTLLFKNSTHVVALSLQYIQEHGKSITTEIFPHDLSCSPRKCTAQVCDRLMFSSTPLDAHAVVLCDQQGLYYVTTIISHTNYMHMIVLIICLSAVAIFILISIPLITCIFHFIKMRTQLHIINENNRKYEKELLRGNSISYGSISPVSSNESRKWIINFKDIRFDRRIGEGTFGVLFQAVVREKQQVAVKMIKHDDQSEEFINEIQMLSTLNHPNVLKFHGITLHNRKMFILTEYCSNGSLDHMIKKYVKTNDSLHQLFSFERKLEMILDVIRGMSYLHGHEPPVLHCDLKLANLLLDKHNTVKVCDFGQSMFLWPTTSDDMIEYNRGTYLYMCPEMVLTPGNFSEKCDVFSFALCMYEIFFEEMAFQSFLDKNPMVDPLMIAVMVAREETRPSIQDIEYSRAETMYLDLMQECWQHEPDERPSFTELEDRLLKIAKEEGILRFINHEEWEHVR
jgi:tRNA A-37 threonylcarbamoyl transferase component Bud32